MKLKNKVKLSYFDARASFEGLTDLINTEMPYKTSYWVKRNISWLEKEVVKLDQKRVDLLRLHAKRDKKGNPLIENNNYVLADEGHKAMVVDWEKFGNQEVMIDKLMCFDPGDFDGVKITPNTLEKLKKIVSDPYVEKS
ncbi:MAG: hypothetical protein ACOWWR_18485 [Eubacteriales bacterium]